MRWREYCARSVRETPLTANVIEQCSTTERCLLVMMRSNRRSMSASLFSSARSSMGESAL